MEYWLSFGYVKIDNPKKQWHELLKKFHSQRAQDPNWSLSCDDLLHLSALGAACVGSAQNGGRMSPQKEDEKYLAKGHIPIEMKKRELVRDLGLFVGANMLDEVRDPLLRFLQKDEATSLAAQEELHVLFFKAHLHVLLDLMSQIPSYKRDAELGLWLASVGEIFSHMQKLIILPDLRNPEVDTTFSAWINSIIQWRHVFFHPERAGLDFLYSKNPMSDAQAIAVSIFNIGKGRSKLKPRDMVADICHESFRDRLLQYVSQLQNLALDDLLDRVKCRMAKTQKAEDPSPVPQSNDTDSVPSLEDLQISDKHNGAKKTGKVKNSYTSRTIASLQMIAAIRLRAEEHWGINAPQVRMLIDELWDKPSKYSLDFPKDEQAYIDYYFSKHGLRAPLADFIEKEIKEFQMKSKTKKSSKIHVEDLSESWKKRAKSMQENSIFPESLCKIFDSQGDPSRALGAFLELYAKSQGKYFRRSNISFSKLICQMEGDKGEALMAFLRTSRENDLEFCSWSSNNCFSDTMPSNWLPQRNLDEIQFSKLYASTFKASQVCIHSRQTSHFSENSTLRNKQVLISKIAKILQDPVCLSYRRSQKDSVKNLQRTHERREKVIAFHKNFGDSASINVSRSPFNLFNACQDMMEARCNKFLPSDWHERFRLCCRIIQLEPSIKSYAVYKEGLHHAFQSLKWIRGFRSHAACVYLPSMFCRGYNKDNIVGMYKHYIKEINDGLIACAKETIYKYLSEDMGLDFARAKKAAGLMFKNRKSRNEIFHLFTKSADPKSAVRKKLLDLGIEKRKRSQSIKRLFVLPAGGA